MTSIFAIEAKVQTHSLTSAEYNGLEGVVTGAAVEKDGVTRVSVRLELSNGEEEGMNLQLKNLLIVPPVIDLEQQTRLQLKLLKAVSGGNVKAIKKCVNSGADVNTPDADSWTPVYNAAHDGQVDVIRALAEYGADVNTPTNDGTTPVFMAAQEGHVTVIRVLAEYGADLNTPRNDGTTPI
jgi:hypothetical protein